MLTRDRDAELLTGEQGETLRKRIWSEIIEGLAKDVPNVRSLAKI